MENLKPLRDSMPIQTITWTVPLARHALQELEQGYMMQAATLADSMTRDDRISATLRTRTRALLGLPRSFVPNSETRTAKKIAATLEMDFDVIAPEETITALMRWAVLLGVAVAELVWERKAQGDSSRWIPRLKVWHPQFLYYRWDTRTWQIQTLDGVKDVVAGNGQWLLLQLGSQRPWMEGLVRELTIPYLARQFAIRDFLRYSEFHGQPTKIAKVPNASTKEDRDLFFKSIRNLGREPLVKMVQSADKNADGYDFSYLEAKANTWTGFRALIDQMDVSIAISVLGQNLTTEVKGGSRSAAEVHERKELDVIEADVAILKTALESQVITHWMNVNYGTLEIPSIQFETKTTNVKEKAEAYSAKAKAIADLVEQGIEITPILSEFGLERDPDYTNSARFYEYHFKFGIMTKNEVRAALGLPPVPNGDEFVQESVQGNSATPTPTNKLNFKQSNTQQLSADGFTNGQLYTDDIVDEVLASALLERDVQDIQNIIEDAVDFADLRAALLEKYKGMDSELMREMLAQALTLADFAGRLAVQDDL